MLLGVKKFTMIMNFVSTLFFQVGFVILKDIREATIYDTIIYRDLTGDDNSGE